VLRAYLLVVSYDNEAVPMTRLATALHVDTLHHDNVSCFKSPQQNGKI
jgi:hypothetical protein